MQTLKTFMLGKEDKHMIKLLKKQFYFHFSIFCIAQYNKSASEGFTIGSQTSLTFDLTSGKNSQNIETYIFFYPVKRFPKKDNLGKSCRPRRNIK